MNAKFTPGPWERQVIAPNFEDVSIRKDRFVIARAYHSNLHNGRANAALIAAAPELYAELVERMSFHRSDCNCSAHQLIERIENHV